MKKITESPRIKGLEKNWGKPVPQLLKDWHWNKNLRHREIGKKLEVPRPTVTRWFKQFNIPTQFRTRFTNNNLLYIGPNQPPRKKKKLKKLSPWHFNKNFFNEWSPEMAYVLGFMFADGYVYTNPRGSKYFCFCSTDKEIILKIKQALKSNHKVGVRSAKRSKYHKKDLYTLQIGNKETCETLNKKFGIVQNKNKVIKLPKNIPEKEFGHYVRGYFDGDGGVYFKQHWCKDRQSFRWVFRSHFTSNNKKFLTSLHKKLLKSSRVKGGYIKNKNRSHELIISHHDSSALYNLMYNNISSELYLDRKYKTFQKAFSILKLN